MRYGERNWREMHDLTERVAVLPLGSTEQHGHHLPLLTDTLIVDEIVRRAEEALDDTALFLPTVWFGMSEHHRGFPGTISVRNETYTQVLIDILESLVGGGFRRIVALNAHGGNAVPARTALYEVQMRHRDERDLWLVFATWFDVAREQIAALPELDQPYVTHACELETSMMLHLRPELVDMEAARGADVGFESAFYVPESSRNSRVIVRRPFDQISVTGAYGHPERGTAAKGATLFDVVVEQVVACVREVASWKMFDPV